MQIEKEEKEKEEFALALSSKVADWLLLLRFRFLPYYTFFAGHHP